MIHRKHEAEEIRYGFNWQVDKSTFALMICFPVWILKYSLYWSWVADNILIGERIVVVSVGIRWSRTAKKFFSRCRAWKTNYRSKRVATREQIEDRLIVLDGYSVAPF